MQRRIRSDQRDPERRRLALERTERRRAEKIADALTGDIVKMLVENVQLRGDTMTAAGTLAALLSAVIGKVIA